MPSPLSPAEIKYETEHIHDNRGPDIVISSAVCIALATAAVCLRLLARRLSRAAVLADDYMMIFALVSQWRTSPFETPRVPESASLVLLTISRR